MIYILYIICSIIVIALFLWVGYYKWKFRSIRHIPGPVAYPIIGNLLDFLDLTNLFELVKNYSLIYGNIIQIEGSPNERILVISDIELIELVLRSPKYITKSDLYRFLDPWLGNGILQADGLLWQKQRKLTTPGFHFKVLEEFISTFDSACDVLIDIFSEYNESKLVDVMPIITSFTLDIIIETAMGTKINAQLIPDCEFVEAASIITDIVVNRALSIWKRYDFLFRFSNEYRKQTKAIKQLDDLSYKVIRAQKQKLLDETSQTIEDLNDTNKTPIFLDILLNTPTGNDVFNDEDYKDAVNSIIFGGHDTTASAISFILYALANNPTVQEKVVNELKEIYGTDVTSPVKMQDLQSMKYIDLVIKEALRLYSPVPIFGRKLIENLNYKGTILPKGVQLMFCTFLIHKNPDVYENPEAFIPERFLTNTVKPYNFLPFSAGPRNCLGQKYAIYELKVTIAKLLRRFEFVTAGPEYNVKLTPKIITKSLNGIHLKIKKRHF